MRQWRWLAATAMALLPQWAFAAKKFEVVCSEPIDRNYTEQYAAKDITNKIQTRPSVLHVSPPTITPTRGPTSFTAYTAAVICVTVTYEEQAAN